MTDAEDFQARVEAVRAQLRDVYRIKGRDLDHELRRARRFMPRRIRKAGQVLVAAQNNLGHPRLEAMINFADIRSAHEKISDHLDRVDVAGMRHRRMLGLFGILAFNVIFVATCFVVWMVWAGHL